jgi:hypothetical protein
MAKIILTENEFRRYVRFMKAHYNDFKTLEKN